MIIKEQIIGILKSNSTYTDRSRTDKCVHESNFDSIAKDVVKKSTTYFAVKSFTCDVCFNETKNKKDKENYRYCNSCKKL